MIDCSEEEKEWFQHHKLEMKDFNLLSAEEKNLYAMIEHEIIRWSIDGTKTAGSLTRILMCIINPELTK